jgi:DNA invertase Pin-like site-specific DNA recombinase
MAFVREGTMRQAAVYLRVSTLVQTTANQERELRDVAALTADVIVRQISAASPLRRGATATQERN